MPIQGKIAFVCSSDAWGGLEINVIRLAIWLKQRGLNITIYAISGSKLQQQAIASDIQIQLITKNKKYLDFAAAFWLSKLFLADKIVTAFVFHNRDMDLLALTKWMLKKKLTLIYQQHMQIGVNKRGWIHSLRYSFYDAWIAPLKSLAEEIKTRTRFNPEKIYIIPLGIETVQFCNANLSKKEARLKLNIKSTGILFGIIGRIDKQKGQDFLIEGISQLKTVHPAIELLIVGETTHGVGDEYAKSLRHLVQKYDMKDSVYFKPFMNETAVFYQAIDIFVLATEGETYGMVTIEAMASGKIIMATNSGGSPEICDFGNYGILFEVGDISDFTTKANYILSHQAEMEEKARFAQEKSIAHYSHENECDLIIELIEGLTKLNPI